MSIDATNWAWSLQDVTSTEKLILLSFADRAGESFEAWPSKKRLELDTCLCFNSVDKAIKSLVKKGHIMKTGEHKNQVPVYRLIGIIPRDLSTTPPKYTPPTKKDTPPKYGVSTPPKCAPPTPPKYGIQNHQLNPKRNPKGKPVLLPIKNLIENEAIAKGIEISEDLASQIEFYAIKSEAKQDAERSVKVAVSIILKNEWRIPSGYNGITSQSIKAKEEQYQREKLIRGEEEAKAARSILSVVGSNSLKDCFNYLH